jgi:hypothetical protein
VHKALHFYVRVKRLRAGECLIGRHRPALLAYLSGSPCETGNVSFEDVPSDALIESLSKYGSDPPHGRGRQSTIDFR